MKPTFVSCCVLESGFGALLRHANGPRMSVCRGRPEVVGPGQNDAIDHFGRPTAWTCDEKFHCG